MADKSNGVMNIYEMFEVDEGLEEDGAWVSWGTLELRIRRSSSKFSRDVLKRIMEPYEGASRRGVKLNDEKSLELDIQWLVEGVISDGRGLTDRTGKALKFTAENLTQVLTDLKEIRREVFDISRGMEAYRLAALEDDAKNFEAPLDGA